MTDKIWGFEIYCTWPDRHLYEEPHTTFDKQWLPKLNEWADQYCHRTQKYLEVIVGARAYSCGPTSIRENGWACSWWVENPEKASALFQRLSQLLNDDEELTRMANDGLGVPFKIEQDKAVKGWRGFAPEDKLMKAT